MCRPGFCVLFGIGSYPRLQTILEAVRSGARRAPVDARYLAKPMGGQLSEKHGEVCSFLDHLYESVAETLPECEQPDEVVRPKKRQKLPDAEDPVVPQDAYLDAKVGVTCEPAHVADVAEPTDTEKRHLPPGTMFDYWKQYCDSHQPGCGFKMFWHIWTTSYKDKLDFRGSFQHAVCGVCIQHKLILRQLSHDTTSRLLQRALYDRHLSNQYRDRRMYWHDRALSRLNTTIVTLIIDGMDQAKFCWPRSVFFRSHAFDSYQRPRLHVTGCIAHGFFMLFTLTHADVRKSGSTTCEILSLCFEELLAKGVNLAQTHVNIQLDNAGNQNKNNIVFRYIGYLVLTGALGSCSANFLRTGHTHEDIDMIFAMLAKWTSKLTRVETLEAFRDTIHKWLLQIVRPHERDRHTLLLHAIRDWKSHLAGLAKRIIGIAGPTAPHVFHFCRRSGHSYATVTLYNCVVHVRFRIAKALRIVTHYTSVYSNKLRNMKHLCLVMMVV